MIITILCDIQINKSRTQTDLFLKPRRAQCTALAQAEAGAIAAAGTARTADARADPAPAPRWYFFRGVRTKAEADFPKPSLRLSYACQSIFQLTSNTV